MRLIILLVLLYHVFAIDLSALSNLLYKKEKTRYYTFSHGFPFEINRYGKFMEAALFKAPQIVYKNTRRFQNLTYSNGSYYVRYASPEFNWTVSGVYINGRIKITGSDSKMTIL